LKVAAWQAETGTNGCRIINFGSGRQKFVVRHSEHCVINGRYGRMERSQEVIWTI